MRLVLIALLVLTMAGAASAADLTKGTPGFTSHYTPSRVVIMCAGANLDNAFYERPLSVYGNAFDLGATAAPLTNFDFIHYGYGFAGPYDYNLWVYDATTCTPVGSVLGLQAADAASAPVEELVDLCPYNIIASGAVIVGVEPLSCLAATDCYPDVMFDQTTPPDGCGSRVDLTTNTCYQITASSGVVDFVCSVTFDECAPPVTGACCLPSGVCEVLTQAACTGLYMGDGTICGPNTLCTNSGASAGTAGRRVSLLVTVLGTLISIKFARVESTAS